MIMMCFFFGPFPFPTLIYEAIDKNGDDNNNDNDPLDTFIFCF